MCFKGSSNQWRFLLTANVIRFIFKIGEIENDLENLSVIVFLKIIQIYKLQYTMYTNDQEINHSCKIKANKHFFLEACESKKRRF